MERVRCTFCNVPVSTPFNTMKTPFNPKGELVLRGCVMCPECVINESKKIAEAEWYDIGDKIPEEGKRYEVYDKESDGVFIATYYGYDPGLIDGQHMFYFADFNLENVTHWREVRRKPRQYEKENEDEV